MSAVDRKAAGKPETTGKRETTGKPESTPAERPGDGPALSRRRLLGTAGAAGAAGLAVGSQAASARRWPCATNPPR